MHDDEKLLSVAVDAIKELRNDIDGMTIEEIDARLSDILAELGHPPRQTIVFNQPILSEERTRGF